MDSIAIIGMGCRFPGAKNPQSFWHLMHKGVDAITEVPPDRWDINAFYDPEPATPGKMSTRYGGFLEQVDQFEPSFFGISPREAKSMDPQQRLVLEVAWEALENAGLMPEKLFGSQTGVFMGLVGSDYDRLRCKDYTRLDAYSGSGSSLSIAANRLSYVLNLRGPSIAIDTACSSSLVAVHLACQSLQRVESNLCLVGGVNLILFPGLSITFSQARMLAADGRCKTFDASADGYVRGEGCGVVVLKRLCDALRDGDNIQAIIRGSAVNQDGLSNGLTAPNGPSQQAVIRQALENALVAPAQISYVEAHGTGTSLGDPIEVKSLKAVLMQGRSPDQTCWIGSVKTNIGHLEAAAGIASLIKVVMSLQHRQIPPHLHLNQLNPYISLQGTTFSIPTKCQPWSCLGTRLAGVSSFGFGGTNCHVILEEAPSGEIRRWGDGEIGRVSSTISPPSHHPIKRDRPLHLLTLRAKSEKALLALARLYEEFLTDHPTASLADVCFTANTGRSPFNHRLAVVAESSVQLRSVLGGFAAGKQSAGLSCSKGYSKKRLKIAFLFTGQGSQYTGMGHQLYDTQPVFRQTLDRCDEILRPYLGESLLTVLYPEPGETPLDQTAYTQPALFALEYALVQMWKSWGVHPDAVMGHSVGEYVAACVAGVFSLEDGLRLIAERARLMQCLPQDGEMVAVFADEATIRAITEIDEQKVAFAAHNGPQNSVISGEQQAVREICAALEATGIKTKKLQTSHAFHSPLVEPMLADFRRVAASVTYTAPQIDLISNVTGQLHAEAITPEYWCLHLRESVQFAASLKTLHASGYEVFVEIGPKRTLLGMGRHCLPEGVGVWLPSLRPGQEDWQQLLQSLGELYVRGVSVDWSGFDRDYQRRRLQLPTYPFQRQRYWIETTEVASQKTQLLAKNGTRSQLLHPLLGQRLHLAGCGEIRFESQITQEMPAFLRHHRIYQMAIVPPTAYLEMALAAGTAVFKSSNLVLEDVAIQQALMLPEQQGKTIQLVLTPQQTSVYSFQIFSLARNDENEEPSWTLHASGKVRVADKEQPSQVDLASLQAQYTEEGSVWDHYQKFREVGIDYGSSLQAIEQIWRHQEQALSRLRIPKSLELEAETYQLHPVLLDACFQVLGDAFPADAGQDAYLPIKIERLEIYRRPGTQLWTQVQIIETKGSNQGLRTANLSLFDASGSVVAQVEGLGLIRTSRKALQQILQKEDLRDWLYQINWQPQPHEPKQWLASVKEQGSWLIFADRGGIGVQLADRLRAQGDRCVLVFSGEIYQRLEAEYYQINPLEPLDFQRLFQNLLKEQPPLRGVVHLWSLQETVGNEISINALQNAQILGCGSVLHLVQALAPAKWSGLQHLWLVTRGAQSLSGLSPVQVQQAPLWGLGRVLALEHPDLHCVCLDLEPSTEQDEISTLFAQLCSPDRENQIAYRQGVRYVPRLVRQKLDAPPNLSSEPLQLKISSVSQPEMAMRVNGLDKELVRSDSSYLITGGLGTLGLKVAHWMVEQGARHLILTGRSGASEAVQKAISQLEQTGAQVLVAQADVSKQEDVARVLETVQASMPPLRGIVHAAGVLDDGLLLQLSWERFTRVMAPKVEGAWNLHILTQNLPLDFFVLFSSAASLIGSPGQGNYAAANAFMDVLAHHRQAQGLPGLSINWGPWAEAGMAASLGNRNQARLAAKGLDAIAPEQGLQVLELLLQSSAQVGVFSVRWPDFMQQFATEVQPPFFTEIAREVKELIPRYESQGEQPQQLEEAPKGDRHLSVTEHTEDVLFVKGKTPPGTITEKLLHRLWCEELVLVPEEVGIHDRFSELGGDSLMALMILKKLEQQYSISTNSSIFAEHQTIAELAAYIDKHTAQVRRESGVRRKIFSG